MKKLTFILVFLLFVIACSNNDNKTAIVEKPIEKTVDAYTADDVTQDIGSFTFDSYSGTVKSRKNPLTSFAKIVKENLNCEKFTLTYHRKWSSGDNPGDVQIVYNRRNKIVQEITANGIADTYRNVTDSVIIKTSEDKECSTLVSLAYYSQTDMKTDYSNRNER